MHLHELKLGVGEGGGRISVRSVMFETLFLITNKTWNSNRAILHRACLSAGNG